MTKRCRESSRAKTCLRPKKHPFCEEAVDFMRLHKTNKGFFLLLFGLTAMINLLIYKSHSEERRQEFIWRRLTGRRVHINYSVRSSEAAAKDVVPIVAVVVALQCRKI